MRRLCVSLVMIVGACGDDGGGGGTESESGNDTATPDIPDDGLPGRPPEGEWIEVVPGGDTICSRGSEYRFFVRGGRPDRIIIDFEGGGACWDELTCSVGQSTFAAEVNTFEEFQGFVADDRRAGLFDGGADVPFGDWTMIHVPYCTGDIHWGDAFVEYTDAIAIEHRGFINATAVLEWVYSRYPKPDDILVSGCSAGAYGAAGHFPFIADQYSDARMSLLADSGAGIITDTFLNDSLPNWNAQLPPFIPALQVPLTELTLPDLYVAIGEHFPQHRLAQTATQFDNDQIFFYSAMGGNAADWPGLFRESIANIESRLPNFTYYIPPGQMHCVTPYPFFYTREVNGAGLQEWSEQLMTGEQMPAPVACEGQECCSDPVCDACVGSDDPWCRFCEYWPPAWSECAQ